MHNRAAQRANFHSRSRTARPHAEIATWPPRTPRRAPVVLYVQPVQKAERPSKTLRELFQIGRYGAVGIIALLIHYNVSILLASAFGVSPMAAHTIGFASGFIVSGLGHAKFTFKVHGPLSAPLLRYLFVTFNALLVSYLALVVFVGVMELPAAISQAGGVIASAGFSYVASRNWAFATSETPAPQSSSNKPLWSVPGGVTPNL